MEYKIIYQRDKYFVTISMVDHLPCEVLVTVGYDERKDYFYNNFYNKWATVSPIRWWQFWLISIEKAITKAQKIVDLHADSFCLLEERIIEKMEELKFREQAIYEIEQEEVNEKRKIQETPLQNSNAASTEAA